MVWANLRAPQLIPRGPEVNDWVTSSGPEGTRTGDHWGANPRPDQLSYPSGFQNIYIYMLQIVRDFKILK